MRLRQSADLNEEESSSDEDSECSPTVASFEENVDISESLALEEASNFTTSAYDVIQKSAEDNYVVLPTHLR